MEVGWGVAVAEAVGLGVWEGVDDELDVLEAVGRAEGLAVTDPDGEAEGDGLVLLPVPKLNPPVAM